MKRSNLATIARIAKVACIVWVLYALANLAALTYQYRALFVPEKKQTEDTFASARWGDLVISEGNRVSMPYEKYKKLLTPNVVKKNCGDGAPEVISPADHPPFTFIAGSFLWRFRYTTEAYMKVAGCGGWTDAQKHEVWLSVGDFDLRETVTHELMHVARAADREQDENSDMLANIDPDSENKFVAPAAPHFRQILRDNPRLVQWLVKK